MELASCQYRGGNRQAIALNNYRISSIQVTLKIPDFLVATVINLDKPVEEVGDLVQEEYRKIAHRGTGILPV
ncbi:MAG: hypothetical protein F6K47_39650 [Symploca sp. SIO2E6]|nr:hypothetical protein [Symploca sp. SIO2E6]